MKTPIRTYLSAVAMMAFLMAYAVFVPQTKANPTLTNGLVAYWPMQATNGGILTPDMSGNGYDLQPWTGSSLVNFGPNAYLVPGPLGNAIEITNGATLLAYLAQPGDLLPIDVSATNYTVSFWFRYNNAGATTASATGQRLWSEANAQVKDPFFDIETVSGSTGFGTLSRQTANNYTVTATQHFSQFGGGGTAQTPTNAGVAAVDGKWHNVTIIETLVTNTTPPILFTGGTNAVGTVIGVPATNGTVTLAWSSIPLDSAVNANGVNYSNWMSQIDTNSMQRYVVQASTNLANPNAWVNVSTNASTTGWNIGSGGPGGSYIPLNYFAKNGTTNATTMVTISNVPVVQFYRVIQPRIRYELNTLIVDGTNIDTSSPPYRPEANNGAGSGYMVPSYGVDHVWNLTTTAFGGIRRGGGDTGFMPSADYYNAAIWNRALSSSELQNFITDGITNAPGGSQLRVVFTVENPVYSLGDTALLSWKAPSSVTDLGITPQVGDVFAISALGIGSTNGPGTTINSNTTFQIVATRGVNTATSQVSVIAVSNVLTGWHYVDSFTYDTAGSIQLQNNWQNPPQGIANGASISAFNVRVAGDGNQYVSFDGYTNVGGWAAKTLGSYASTLNNSNTLFFRFYIDPEWESTGDPNEGGSIPDINVLVGLTDKVGIRDVADIDQDNDNGDTIRFLRAQAGNGGAIDLVCPNGPTAMALSPSYYSYVQDGVNGSVSGLTAGHVYAVWMDVQNRTNAVSGGVETNGDLYSVSIQDETAAGARKTLFTGFTSSRDLNAQGLSPTTETVGTLFVDMDDGAGVLYPTTPNAITMQETNMVRFDDFYMSKNGSGGGGNNGILTTKPVSAKTASDFTP